MLPAIADTIEEIEEQDRQHYVEKDGKFHLDVESVSGFALEDVTGLKKTVGTLRQNESSLKKQLEEVNKRFEDIDPEEARNALSKFDEIKNWDGDKKAEEKIEAAKRELVKRHQKEKEDLEGQLSNVQSQLTDALVDTKIVEALNKEEGNVELLMPHVKSRVRMVQNAEGKYYPEVVDETGTQRFGDSDGTPMTIHQYIQEMKSSKTFSAAFPGANHSGSGGGNDSPQKTRSGGKSKVVNASDTRSLSSNLEEIASGKVQVDMNS